jgi:hypothetical protein
MSTIKKNELFGNLKSFLKSKGVELQDGVYAKRLQKSCDLLTDSVNLSQQAFEKAKNAMDKGIDGLRRVVHEHTAPKSGAKGPAPAGGKARAKAAKTGPRKSSKQSK